jgi:hypothetical protein
MNISKQALKAGLPVKVPFLRAFLAMLLSAVPTCQADNYALATKGLIEKAKIIYPIDFPVDSSLIIWNKV